MMKRNTLIAGLTIAGLIAAGGAASAFGKKEGHERMHGMPGMHEGPMIPFEEIDANGDGKITKAEMDAHAKARFAKADANGDGKLTADEMKAAADERRAERMDRRMAKMIERFDADGDGALSFGEMPGQNADNNGRMGEMFEMLDADGDGALSKEEMAEMRGKFGRHGKRPFGHKKPMSE